MNFSSHFILLLLIITGSLKEAELLIVFGVFAIFRVTESWSSFNAREELYVIILLFSRFFLFFFFKWMSTALDVSGVVLKFHKDKVHFIYHRFTIWSIFGWLHIFALLFYYSYVLLENFSFTRVFFVSFLVVQVHSSKWIWFCENVISNERKFNFSE